MGHDGRHLRRPRDGRRPRPDRAGLSLAACAVQPWVYTDPKELADAYSTPPPYPQLSAAQVAAFNQRVTSDAAFATRLTERVRSTCGASPAAGPPDTA